MPDKDYTAFAFETITVASANIATNLTKSVYDSGNGLPARAAIITVGTGPLVSYVFGGVTVGSATGHTATPFSTINLVGNQQIRDFSSTSVSSGTTAVLKVTYFR